MNNDIPSIAEEKFQRTKTTTVYDYHESTVDVTTGEIINNNRLTQKRTSNEPDYIKVYYKAMMAVHDIDDIPITFILGIATYMSYTNNADDKLYFDNNKRIRNFICANCNIKESMYEKYLTRCKQKGIIFKTEYRGTYEVNPWLIAKGKWENIKSLQTKFDYINNTWVRTLTEDTPIINAEAEEQHE